MEKFKGKYRIDSARAKWWDYNNEGYYFITICVKNNQHLFGYVKDGVMILNEYGKIVFDCWYDLPNHYKNIVLDELCIMPNHIHCIIGVDNSKLDMACGMALKSAIALKPVCTADQDGNANMNANSNKEISRDNLEGKAIKIHGVFEFIRAFKTFSSRRINEIRDTKGTANWQERFHDVIIRDDVAYNRIKNYIINNPKKWNEDCFYKL